MAPTTDKLTRKQYQFLNDLYTNVQNTETALSSFKQIWRYIKNKQKTEKDKNKLSRKSVLQWYRSMRDGTNLSLPRKSSKRHKRFFSTDSFQKLAGDIVDLSKLKRWNHGYRYLLLLKDFFSKFVLCAPLKVKTGPVVRDSFKNLINTDPVKNYTIKQLVTDRGSEFIASTFSDYCDSMKIKQYFCYRKHHSSIVERQIRLVRRRIWAYLATHNTRRYITVLDKIIDNLNNSPSRKLPSQYPTPNAVIKGGSVARSAVYFHNLPKLTAAEKRMRRHPPAYPLGSLVVHALTVPQFQKRSTAQRFSTDVYRVDKIYSGLIKMYRLRELEPPYEKLDHLYYEHELRWAPNVIKEGLESAMEEQQVPAHDQDYIDPVGYGTVQGLHGQQQVQDDTYVQGVQVQPLELSDEQIYSMYLPAAGSGLTDISQINTTRRATRRGY